VDLIGIPQHRRGIGGVPAESDAPLVTLSMREAAYHLPEIPDAPVRLVAAITDALVGVLRPQTLRFDYASSDAVPTAPVRPRSST
jgi:hypothetical protein